MSRRRVRERSGDLPGWLAEYRPEQWAEDLDDPVQVHYFGRVAWGAAQREWAAGGDPQPKIQTPQTRSREQRVNGTDGQAAGEGVTRHPQREPRARPIKSY